MTPRLEDLLKQIPGQPDARTPTTQSHSSTYVAATVNNVPPKSQWLPAADRRMSNGHLMHYVGCPFEKKDGSVCGVEVQAYSSNMLSHWSTHCEIPLEAWHCTFPGCKASFTRKDARDNHINSQHKQKGSAAAAAAELFKKRKL